MPDTSKKLDFHKLFEDFNTANQKVWEHDRSTTVGASEVFTCLRKAWFEKRAKEFGDRAGQRVQGFLGSYSSWRPHGELPRRTCSLESPSGWCRPSDGRRHPGDSGVRTRFRYA
jgi:hypothetical protein